MKAKLTVFGIISLTVFTQVIWQAFIFRSIFNWDVISQYFISSAVFIIAAYWIFSCTFVHAVATDILALAKVSLSRRWRRIGSFLQGVNISQKALDDGVDDQKVHQITLLWLTLCELTEQFNAAHSDLFLFYFVMVFITSIVVAYSCTFVTISHGESFNRTPHLIALPILVMLVLVVCEKAYSVNKQVNIRNCTIRSWSRPIGLFVWIFFSSITNTKKRCCCKTQLIWRSGCCTLWVVRCVSPHSHHFV